MPEENTDAVKNGFCRDEPTSVKAALPLSLQQKFARAATVLTTAYLCAMFFVLPLVFSNYYFNITETSNILS